jgi:hypothetical protein
MAQRVNSTGASGFPLTLSWTNWETGDEYQVEYDLVDNKLQRSYYAAGESAVVTIVAQFIDPDPTKTRFGFTAGGAFYLPDINDALTISDPFGGDSGIITVTSPGQISVNETGSATYNAGSGAWTTPAPDDTLVINATKVDTAGTWTATTAAANISFDTDEDATITAVLVLKVTATVGTGSQEASETRVYEIMPRPGS